MGSFDLIVKSVPCTKCGAQIGDRCKSPAGNQQTAQHADRVKAFEAFKLRTNIDATVISSTPIKHDYAIQVIDETGRNVGRPLALALYPKLRSADGKADIENLAIDIEGLILDDTMARA